MKRLLAGLSIIVLLGGLGVGQSILLLNEQCNRSTAYFPTALTNLGLEFTETNDDEEFSLALTTGGPWDVVIVDEYSDWLSPQTLLALSDYIASGGRAYMNFWDWNETIAASFEAALGASYDEPVPIYPWNEGHPLLTTPNVVSLLRPAADTCDCDGAFFSATGGGVEVAGYTPAPGVGQAAIIVGNEGRTVLFGGIIGLFGGDEDGDGRKDGLEFAENVIAFLVARPITRPRPALWTAVSAADIEGLLAEMEIPFESLVDSAGLPAWTLTLSGATVRLFVYDPTADGSGLYGSLQLYMAWPVAKKPSAALINGWNLTKRGSRAYLNDNDDPALDADLYLVGGVSWKAVRAFIERFGQSITDFRNFLGQ